MGLASCQLLHSAVKTRRLAIFGMRGTAYQYYLQHLYCLIPYYSIQAVLIGHYLVQQSKSGECGVSVYERTVQKCNGLVVVRERAAGRDIYSCALADYLSPPS